MQLGRGNSKVAIKMIKTLATAIENLYERDIQGARGKTSA
jgi:hypothetical protein